MTGGKDEQLEAFRAKARAWLAANFSPDLVGKSDIVAIIESGAAPSPEAAVWRKAMGEKGWGVPTWPREYGGGGLSRAEAKILSQEMRRIGAWNPIAGMGVIMFGPTLLEFGTDRQPTV